jgi:multicomponent Na+:H+ antiporter subunit G
MSAIFIISIVLLLLGAFFMLVAAAGVIRFPDFYTRLHAAGIGDTLGQSLILLGLALPVFAVGFGQVAFKLLLIMLFVFVFNPTATHALARGAWIIGLEPWKKPADADDAEAPSEDGEGRH